MYIDLTQKIIEGFTYRQGSPALKIDNKKCYEIINGKQKEYFTAVINCASHNMGTHIDTINAVDIPIEKLVTKGIKYDVRDIDKVKIQHIDVNRAEEGNFVFFQTGWDKFLYKEEYYDHPEIDIEVIQALVHKKVNMIGIDTMGLGKAQNHGIIDKLLATKQMYAIENLTNLDKLPNQGFIVYCFPLKIQGVEAHPARIIAEI